MCCVVLPTVCVRWLPLQATALSLFTEQVTLNFGRVLLTWFLYLVAFQLPAPTSVASAGEHRYARCAGVSFNCDVRALPERRAA